jgi:hypothetical protein
MGTCSCCRPSRQSQSLARNSFHVLVPALLHGAPIDHMKRHAWASIACQAKTVIRLGQMCSCHGQGRDCVVAGTHARVDGRRTTSHVTAPVVAPTRGCARPYLARAAGVASACCSAWPGLLGRDSARQRLAGAEAALEII